MGDSFYQKKLHKNRNVKEQCKTVVLFHLVQAKFLASPYKLDILVY